MAQEGASDMLNKLRLEKAQRAWEVVKGASSSAAKTLASCSAQQVPPVDPVPPLVEKKQKKRKTKSKEKR